MKNSNQVEQLTETPDLMGADLDDKAKVWLNDLLWQQRQARLGQSDAASSWSKDCVFLGALGLQSKPVWNNQMVSNEYQSCQWKSLVPKGVAANFFLANVKRCCFFLFQQLRNTKSI